MTHPNRMKIAAIAGSLFFSSVAFASPQGLAESVASDLNELFGDTVNEGDRTASVQWNKVPGRVASPRVECIEVEAQPSAVYLCEVGVTVELEYGDPLTTTCSGLEYAWDGRVAERIDIGTESPFDACLEDIGSAE